MASGSSICMAKPLQHEDARSWFKWIKLCAAANEWDAVKQLLHLLTLLRGHSWAIYESLSDADKETYRKLKKAILERLHPDTEENCLAAWGQLSQMHFHKGSESIDELARDLEKLLNQASPGLPVATCKTELRLHLMCSLPDNISFQLKLQPKCHTQPPLPKCESYIWYLAGVVILTLWTQSEMRKKAAWTEWSNHYNRWLNN